MEETTLSNIEFKLNDLKTELEDINAKLDDYKSDYPNNPKYYDSNQLSIVVYNKEYRRNPSLWESGPNGEDSFVKKYENKLDNLIPYFKHSQERGAIEKLVRNFNEKDFDKWVDAKKMI